MDALHTAQCCTALIVVSITYFWLYFTGELGCEANFSMRFETMRKIHSSKDQKFQIDGDTVCDLISSRSHIVSCHYLYLHNFATST